jgi:hypothetical protein
MASFVVCLVCQTQANLLPVVSETSMVHDYYHCSVCARVWTTPKGVSEPVSLLTMTPARPIRTNLEGVDSMLFSAEESL